MLELHVAVGLGGVAKKERKPIRKIDTAFRVVMVLVGVALLMQWHLDWVDKLTPLSTQIFNWVIWLFFTVEVVVLLFTVAAKRVFLKRNWLKCLIIIFGVPLLLNFSLAIIFAHYARPVLALLLLTPWFDFVKRSLTDNRLGTTLITVFAVVIIAGFLISGIDPGIQTPWDGFWWAWVTLSTVGFGDLVPTSGIGRLFSALVILIGLGFFSILTANFASLFLRRDMRRMLKDSEKILAAMKELPHISNEQKIVKLINEHDKRLHVMERHLNKIMKK